MSQALTANTRCRSRSRCRCRCAAIEMALIIWSCLGGLSMWLPLVAAGSCREAQLCCNGRDSSCVVQKAPINAIIEDLSDKPCYCDHACLKLGDCCDDFKDHCGVLDCQVGEWQGWSECDKSCGAGMMQRTRQILQAAQNGGKHCPTLVQKRACQGYRCHGHRDKKILREMALLLPASLSSHSRHVNDSSDQRRRSHYRDSYKFNREHEYCVEFEVIKSSKACHKLPPYNLMLEGDRITVRCDLEALVQDKDKDKEKENAAKPTDKMLMGQSYLTEQGVAKQTLKDKPELEQEPELELESGESESSEPDADDNNDDDEQDNEEEDADNMLEQPADTDSHRSHHARSVTFGKHSGSSSSSSNPNFNPPALLQQFNYHCRGEGLAGRTTRWSALPAPSCRGKWLRLTVGPPKKCNHAQFTFV
ncbi:uncharacterized protein LOC108606955 [Drosophila busckii]|uniref:uncharacterized protein LOC108606955 n=1 Tax=Drosophila busckii TaxID=30019 RepID=UPI00083F2F57|nr:uncharacterized protein LOC108606955 [Drosophila busckii]